MKTFNNILRLILAISAVAELILAQSNKNIDISNNNLLYCIVFMIAMNINKKLE